MIISLKYNYLYMRPRKTGSSTIEVILYENLGPDDLFIKEDLQILAPIVKPGVVIPQNKRLVTHIKVSDIRHMIRDDIWDRLYKFTSERHPYEKAVSYAYFKHRNRALRKHPEFEDWLDHAVRVGEYASFPVYSIDGRSVADDYIRLESIETDIRRVGERVGFPVPKVVPVRRATERDDKRPAREILSAQQRDIVFEHCRPEFELLGYER
ncbi:MAG TPA: hypothetical protein VHW69_03985 [Rhizomicrobium sp.]|jgi:hypothetical protein|nr:hypothetical protein [Rhizomicrobium sp.]